MERLSAVIITRDEEENVRRLLPALGFADEILVVDSGSTDRTVEICEGWPNTRVVHQPFLGYGPQKRFAVDAAAHDWVLSLDADELPDPELVAAIESAREEGFRGRAGFWLRRSLVFMDRTFTRGQPSRERVLRLFDRRRGGFTDAEIHEHVELDGPTGELAGRLLHYSYRDLEHYFEKSNRYTSLTAVRRHARGKRATVPGIVLRPPVVFLQYYLLRGSCLNGFPGFVHALLAAFYKTVRELKLYELKSRGEGD